MTKKQFVAFAEYIKAERNEFDRIKLAKMVALIAGRDNPHFDQDRFLRACDLSPRALYEWRKS